MCQHDSECPVVYRKQRAAARVNQRRKAVWFSATVDAIIAAFLIVNTTHQSESMLSPVG